MKRKYESRVTSHERRATSDECVGSALILAVVLTSLLAIIGTVFLMVARVDKIATSAITENKELEFALESVVAKISQELALDIPNEPAQEYYDYPDPCNAFLASLEPNESGGSYYWRQVSDVTGTFGSGQRNVPADIVGEHERIDTTGIMLADADGDGVSDSIWIELNNGMTTSKGKPIFAAIRLIDNGGMLNVNTAYKFDPTEAIGRIDGSSQMQINLMALSWRPGYSPYNVADESDLSSARGHNVTGLDPLYEQNVIWQFGGQFGLYTPFGIDDELELRNRFLLNHEGIDTRLEGWGGEFRKTVLSTPVTTGGQELDKWFKRTCFDPSILDPNLDPSDPNYYAFRHISTAYNMDRIINPVGPTLNYGKMLNVNRIATSDLDRLYRMLIRGISPSVPDVDAIAAQLAVNIKDFGDSDTDVTVYPNPDDGKTYYGFERPCIYISELACRLKQDSVDPGKYYRSYAVELYKPYSGDDNPDPNWQLVISNPDSTTPINWSGASPYHVIKWEAFVDPCVPLDVNATLLPQQIGNPDTASFVVFEADSVISLTREVNDVNVVVDSKIVPGGWMDIDGDPHSIQRDITRHKCILRLWNDIDEPNTLGADNGYTSGDPDIIQAHPENTPFTSIGDIGKVFRKSAYSQGPNPIGSVDTEATARLNLTDPAYQHIFNYLTVMDPAFYPWNNPDETRVKGRININTAPWFVIAQLPWVSPQLAQAIVAYRDKTVVPGQTDPNYIDKYISGLPDGRLLGTGISGLREIPGFASISELTTVINIYAGLLDEYNIRKYALDSVDQSGFPDLTGGDGAADDFEERDLIFSRISNLVTVRSDVFTAYILVRIGVDGPQKRAIAILDRSQVSDISGKVKVIALHPVPDPR